MAHLSLDNAGRLVLEAPFDDPRVGRALRGPLLAFVVVERTDNTIVLDKVENNVEAIDYLAATVGQVGMELTLGADLEAAVSSHAAERAQLEDARKDDHPTYSALPVPDFRPDVKLLPHQVRGVERALQVGNFAEFSVQGAGKTMTVLATFAHWRERGEVERLLVIGPLSSFQPWEDEVARCFIDQPKVLRWSGSGAIRTRMVPAYRRSDIVLCSYDTAWRDVQMLGQQLRATPTVLVLDESHYIKNFEIGARGAAALELAPHAAKRLILSGTPAPHSLLDLYSQFAFLWPGAKQDLVGTPQQYLTRLSRSPTPAADLRTSLGPFFHRTSQSELGLGEPTTHTERIPLSVVPPGQARVISLLENKLAVEARNLPTKMDRELLSQWRKARIVRLLQAASNPSLLSSAEDLPRDPRVTFDVSELSSLIAEFRDGSVRAAKIEWAVQKARELIAAGNKVLMWTWWVSNIHLLADVLEEFNPLLLYGQIKPYEDFDDPSEVSRERNIRDFKTRDDRPLLIANPSACAESISLHQVCHNAVYVDRTYNCGQFLQSLNRIHRIGLPKGAVTEYWIPVVDCAVERSVDRRLQQRQRTMYDLLGDDAPVLGIDWKEETVSVDSDDEAQAAFQDLVTELPG
ncbi:MAG: DEAD/DEAH box helicase [Dehalococcoidia bacterium]|nr:DEAD/DEAH box helicase [Dehalococcoidia bacterium]